MKLFGTIVVTGMLVATGARADGIADFTPEARRLYQVVACADGQRPKRFRVKAIDRHCQILSRKIAAYRRGWMRQAEPFFARLVPKNVSRTVVYPFAGGDLLTALVVFPNMRELTTMSVEPAGDPRAIDKLSVRALGRSLAQLRYGLLYLLRKSYSATVNLEHIMIRSRLPGQLIFSLTALVVRGYEPVRLRYFRFDASGRVVYLRRSQIPAFGRLRTSARNQLFGNMELVFRKRGRPKAKPIVYRHVHGNLANKYLSKPMMAHLRAKGRVTAMTKAAAYLLWWSKFSKLRNYLLKHVDWMVSDATGFLPMHARPAGFQQRTWGRFHGVILNIARWLTADAVRLWKSRPYRRMPFRFGYPDSRGHNHLLVTYRKK